VSEFDDDKPKKKSKQKRENRKAVRQLRKEATTRTITRGMSPDGKGGGPSSRSTTPKVAKEKVAKEKVAKEKKSKLDKKLIKAKKRGINPEFIKKKAKEKAQREIERQGKRATGSTKRSQKGDRRKANREKKGQQRQEDVKNLVKDIKRALGPKSAQVSSKRLIDKCAPSGKGGAYTKADKRRCARIYNKAMRE
jgi:hypothetical protein